MTTPDLSRKALLKRIKGLCSRSDCSSLIHAELAIEAWQKYGGFERVRDLLLKKLFDASSFEFAFSNDAFTMASTVDRYYLLDFLISQEKLDLKNLEGKIIDIGCHLGATVDALAMYGGEVIGTDSGDFASSSPIGIPIGRREGRDVVQGYSSYPNEDKPSLVTCFNVDWVEDMSGKGFRVGLYEDSMTSLKPNGQVLYTFSEKHIRRYRALLKFPHSVIIELPSGKDEREEYVFIAQKISGN